MNRLLCLFLFISFLFVAPDMWAQQKATPKAGEGISSFLLRHNRAPKKYYDDFVELNKAKLGKDKTLKMGVTYLIPPAKSSVSAATAKSAPAGKNVEKQDKPKPARRTEINEPLFGKLLANTKVTSSRLAGACFYVVSGHGGPDPGAIGRVGKHELHEDEYAYDIALRLARNLMQEGAEVDSRSKGTQTDVFFYHSNRKADSKRLANNMKDTFESKYGKHQPNRGFSGTVSGRNLYVLAHTTPVSVFVELGNIQNTLDQRRLVIPSNRQALAKWLMEGFLKDYKGM